MFDIEKIRKKMTRTEFINEGSCPSEYGLINKFDECSSISYHNCCKCREAAAKDIIFKDDVKPRKRIDKKYYEFECIKDYYTTIQTKVFSKGRIYKAVRYDDGFSFVNSDINNGVEVPVLNHLMEEFFREKTKEELKKYAGWEIVKMIAEKQLKEGTKVIWHQKTNTSQTYFILRGDGCLYSAKYHKEAGISFFINAVGHNIKGYFTIEQKEYLTFDEARNIGIPKHKYFGYSIASEISMQEFLQEMDKKVWYVE